MASALWNGVTLSVNDTVNFYISPGWEQPTVWIRGITAGSIRLEKYMGFENGFVTSLVDGNFEEYINGGNNVDWNATNNIHTIDSPGWWRLKAQASIAGTIYAGLEK